jgi:hypothetical protein
MGDGAGDEKETTKSSSMVVGTLLLDTCGAVEESSILLGRLEVKEVASGAGTGGIVGDQALPYVGMEAGNEAMLAK